MTTNNLYENWIKALRNGNYENGKHQLKTTTKDNNLFCCLGVLCDISNLGRWECLSDFTFDSCIYNTEPTPLNENTYNERTTDAINKNYSSLTLPIPVQVAAQLRTNLGDFKLDELPTDLQNTITSNINFSEDQLQEYGMSLSNINDYYRPPNVFEIIAQVLEARPPSLFVQASDTGE